jgi:hypothetical protein
MIKRIATDPGERKVLDDIAKYGWHCVNILEEADQPPWSFTIGLFESWKHPELVIFGLKRDIAHEILNIVAADLAAGKSPDLSRPNDDLAEGYSCMFLEVPKASYRKYVGFACWYYRGNNFPLYQIAWPSKEGAFPWEAHASDSLKKWQPVIGRVPIGA